MKKWLLHVLDFVMPTECHICGSRLAIYEKFVCTSCIKAFPRTGYHRITMNPMEQRFAGMFPYEKATGYFFYSRDSSVSRLIQDMKYRNFPDIGILLGNVVGRELSITGFFNDIDLIVPTPMHFLKKGKRGYNQVEKIAEGLSEATGISTADVLKMTRRHKTQTALDKHQRFQNTEGLFGMKKGADVSGKGRLLVDDVCTTGSTITSAAKAIHSANSDVRLSILTIGVTF